MTEEEQEKYIQEGMQEVYKSLIEDEVETNWEGSIYLGDDMYLDPDGHIYEE